MPEVLKCDNTRLKTNEQEDYSHSTMNKSDGGHRGQQSDGGHQRQQSEKSGDFTLRNIRNAEGRSR